MVVGVLRLELILHAPGSLKEKRAVVRSIIGRCRSRFPVSAAETGMHELWQRTQLGFAMVGQDEASIHALFERVADEVERSAVAEISDRQSEFLHYE